MSSELLSKVQIFLINSIASHMLGNSNILPSSVGNYVEWSCSIVKSRF